MTRTILLSAAFACLFVLCGAFGAHAAASQPNIILIMSDDMGWSDLGCYGSEIATPNLDSLAHHGVRFTQFYNTARCCPTRASLLTGLYPHQAGIGHMMESRRPATRTPGGDGAAMGSLGAPHGRAALDLEAGVRSTGRLRWRRHTGPYQEEGTEEMSGRWLS